MSCACGARIRVAATPGSSTGWAPTSGSAARPVAATCWSSGGRSSAGSPPSSSVVTPPSLPPCVRIPRARPPDPRRDRGRGHRRHRPDLGRPGRLPQPAVPASVAVPGRDPDRRQHGPLRADRRGRRLDDPQHRGQPADPVVPGAGRRPERGRRCLRGPHRSPEDPRRDQRAPWPGDDRPVPRRGELPAHPAAQHVRVRRDRVLRPGGGGDDPAGRPALAAAGRERRVHADPQRGVRDRVRVARPAGRQHRQPGGGDPGRRVPLPAGGRLLLDPAALAAAGDRQRPGCPSGRRDAQGRRSDRDAAARGPRLHPGEPLDHLVAGLPRDHGVPGRRPRRARSGLRQARHWACRPRTSRSSCCPSGSGS